MASQTPLISRIPTPTPAPNTNTQDPTVNWKTYANNYLGFILKYPPDWGNSNEFRYGEDKGQVKPENSDLLFSPEAMDYQKKSPQNLGMPSGYWIEYKYGEDTISKFSYFDPDEHIVSNLRNFILNNGQKGSYGLFKDKGSDDHGVNFEIPFKDGLLVLTLRTFDRENISQDKKYEEIFNDILATLTFENNSQKLPSPTNSTRNY